MSKDQQIAQILDTLGLYQIQERAVVVNIYIVESLTIGPGDFQPTITQTIALNPGALVSKINQSVARTGKDAGLDPAANGQKGSEETKMDVVSLAVAATALLGAKAAGKLAETIGGEVGNRMIKLYETVKAKLTSPAAQEALADFEGKPDDARRKGALELQLEKAIEADPDFRKTLAALIDEIRAKGGDAIVQTANVTGNRNVTTQIAGSGNVVC